MTNVLEIYYQNMAGSILCELLVLLSTVLIIVSAQLPDNSANPILEYTVTEEENNTYIGSIASSDHLSYNFDESTIASFAYEFVPRPNQDASLFTLSRDTGEMRTEAGLDREVYCPRMEECYMYVDVAVVEPREHFQVMTVKIGVLDKNDFTPEFSAPSLTLVFSESTPLSSAGQTIPPAADLDSPGFGITRYVLVPDIPEFGLISPGDEGNPGGFLRVFVKAKLDREKKDTYDFKLYVFDGGNPPLSDSLDLTITVEDANDNAPQFTQTTYEVEIPESWPTNTPFTQVQAKDVDQGDNAKISYFLSPSSEGAFGRVFSVDEDSGDIYLEENLDYESKTQYELIVIAMDGGQDANVVESKVHVTVTDVNDYIPTVQVNTLTDNSEARISEDDLPGTFVAYVSVFDADSGSNAITSCSLNDPTFTLETLTSGTQYKVVTMGRFDREKRATYTLLITCSDQGEPPLKGIENFTVKINDVNDNAPQFDQSEYYVEIQENNAIDEVLLNVHATDQDSGKNGELSYSITDGALSQFVRVNEQTGEIRAKVPLDYEALKSLSFEVIVSDGGVMLSADGEEKSARLQGRAVVTVTLTDLNDEAPVFNKQIYPYDAYENDEAIVPLGDVTAKDGDAEPYNRIVYSLEQSPDAARFSVRAKTGLIMTAIPLDRETQEKYVFKVIATDEYDSSFQGTATVEVTVLDRNDNAPQITFPSPGNNTVAISNKLPIGHIVCQIHAKDSDIVQNSKLSYSVFDDVNNIVKDLFVVDGATGAVMTTRDIQELNGKLFRLSVLVRDHGDPYKTATDYLTITIDSSIPYISTDGESKELVKGNNLTTIIAVSVVSAIIVIGLAIVILFIKLKDTRHSVKTKMPQFSIVQKRWNSGSDCQSPVKYDGVEAGQAAVYTMENDSKDLYQLPLGGPDISASLGTRSSDHSLLYDKRLEHRASDIQNSICEEEEVDSNSSGDMSNADSGRGPSVDGDHNNSNREYAIHPSQVPDLLQRRHQSQKQRHSSSIAPQIAIASDCVPQPLPSSVSPPAPAAGHQPQAPPPRHQPQAPPPSYQSFLRRKSQGRGGGKRHIHFTGDHSQQNKAELMNTRNNQNHSQQNRTVGGIGGNNHSQQDSRHNQSHSNQNKTVGDINVNNSKCNNHSQQNRNIGDKSQQTHMLSLQQQTKKQQYYDNNNKDQMASSVSGAHEQPAKSVMV